MKKIGKLFTLTALVLGTAMGIGTTPIQANAETVPAACTSTDEIGTVGGIDYSPLHISLTCVPDDSLGGTGWGQADPQNREVTIYYGPGADKEQIDALLAHENMHIIHFWSVGLNEVRLNNSMGYTTTVDWRANLYSGTPGDAEWRQNKIEGIANGWPTCFNVYHFDLVNMPQNCDAFTTSVKSTLRQAGNSIVAPYMGSDTLYKSTPTDPYVGDYEFSFPYVNLPATRNYYEVRIQGNGIDKIIGGGSVTPADPKKGFLNIPVSIPESVPSNQIYKIVVFRYLSNPDGSRGTYAQPYPAGKYSNVVIKETKF